jgi:hypothetical protein
MTLYVVYTLATGHVVGAVNAIDAAIPLADADTPIDPGLLVGDALPLRISLDAGEIASLPLLARELAVHTPDDEPGVFADPLAFGFEGDKPKISLSRLPTWDTPLSFTNAGLAVTVPVVASHDTPVLVLVSEGQDTLMRPGTITAGSDTVTLPVTVSAGPHGVLVLVAGWAGRLEPVAQQ